MPPVTIVRTNIVHNCMHHDCYQCHECIRLELIDKLIAKFPEFELELRRFVQAGFE